MRLQRGFTLVELLVVLAIFGILFLIVGTISSNTLPKSQLIIESDYIEQTLRKAQARTVNQHADSVWGVYLTASTVTLFAGTTYAGRDASFDEVHTLPSGVSLSGLSEVNFEYRTGQTVDTGTISMTSSATGETAVLTVSASGAIEQS